MKLFHISYSQGVLLCRWDKAELSRWWLEGMTAGDAAGFAAEEEDSVLVVWALFIKWILRGTLVHSYMQSVRIGIIFCHKIVF